MTCERLKLDKVKYFNDLHQENIYSIFVTEIVLKFIKFNDES